MQNVRCPLAGTSAVGYLLRRPATNRDGDALAGRRLLVRPGARIEYTKHDWPRFVELERNHIELRRFRFTFICLILWDVGPEGAVLLRYVASPYMRELLQLS